MPILLLHGMSVLPALTILLRLLHWYSQYTTADAATLPRVLSTSSILRTLFCDVVAWLCSVWRAAAGGGGAA